MLKESPDSQIGRRIGAQKRVNNSVLFVMSYCLICNVLLLYCIEHLVCARPYFTIGLILTPTISLGDRYSYPYHSVFVL